MSDPQRGVIIYGHGVNAVTQALQEIDSRFVLADDPVLKLRLVPVLRCRSAAEADAVRDMAPDIAWLVVDLYQPGASGEHARNPVMSLNTSKVDPMMAARAIAQPDLVTWYEIIDPIRVTTVGGRPVANDYSNLEFTVPDDNRMVAHAIKEGGPPPDCLEAAEQILPSHDLWALAGLRGGEVCQVCTDRHA